MPQVLRQAFSSTKPCLMPCHMLKLFMFVFCLSVPLPSCCCQVPFQGSCLSSMPPHAVVGNNNITCHSALILLPFNITCQVRSCLPHRRLLGHACLFEGMPAFLFPCCLAGRAQPSAAPAAFSSSCLLPCCCHASTAVSSLALPDRCCLPLRLAGSSQAAFPMMDDTHATPFQVSSFCPAVLLLHSQLREAFSQQGRSWACLLSGCHSVIHRSQGVCPVWQPVAFLPFPFPVTTPCCQRSPYKNTARRLWHAQPLLMPQQQGRLSFSPASCLPSQAARHTGTALPAASHAFSAFTAQ